MLQEIFQIQHLQHIMENLLFKLMEEEHQIPIYYLIMSCLIKEIITLNQFNLTIQL